MGGLGERTLTQQLGLQRGFPPAVRMSEGPGHTECGGARGQRPPKSSAPEPHPGSLDAPPQPTQPRQLASPATGTVDGRRCTHTPCQRERPQKGAGPHLPGGVQEISNVWMTPCILEPRGKAFIF